MIKQKITCYRCGKTFIEDLNADRRFKVLESDGCWNYNDINLCMDCHKELVHFLRSGANKTQKVVTGEVEQQLANLESRVKQLQECVIEHNKCILDIRVDINAIKDANLKGGRQ